MRKREVLCRQIVLLCLGLLEILLISLLLNQEQPMSATDWLTAYTSETESFRNMAFGDGLLEEAFESAGRWDEETYSILAAWLVESQINADKGGSSDPQSASVQALPDYRRYRELVKELQANKPVEWMKLVNAYRTVLADIRYFPVALREDGLDGLAYEDGWGEARTYGGDRRHEGTDICDRENIRGNYPIVSISDGVIEHIGWLEQGGYRIGIRSPHGAYFYYAHLASYAENFAEGQAVSAGQLIGFMGDTGYSAVEGTTGNFPVHLHLGIYLETDHYSELSVNPYYILKYLENSTISYANEIYLWYTELE